MGALDNTVDPSPLILTNLQGQGGEPHWEGETVGQTRLNGLSKVKGQLLQTQPRLELKFSLFSVFIYLAHWVLAVVCGIFSCGMWDLVL